MPLQRSDYVSSFHYSEIDRCFITGAREKLIANEDTDEEQTK